MPVVSPNATRSAPSATTRSTIAGHPLRVDVPLVRAAEAGRHDHLGPGARAVQQVDQLGDVVQRLVGGPVDVAPVVRVAGRDHHLDLGEAGGQGPLRAPRCSAPAPSSARPSAFAAALPTPRRRRPSAGSPSGARTTPPRSAARRCADSASSSRTLASVGTGSSFCSPSRGPTSRIETIRQFRHKRSPHCDGLCGSPSLPPRPPVAWAARR